MGIQFKDACMSLIINSHQPKQHWLIKQIYYFYFAQAEIWGDNVKLICEVLDLPRCWQCAFSRINKNIHMYAHTQEFQQSEERNGISVFNSISSTTIVNHPQITHKCQKNSKTKTLKLKKLNQNNWAIPFSTFRIQSWSKLFSLHRLKSNSLFYTLFIFEEKKRQTQQMLTNFSYKNQFQSHNFQYFFVIVLGTLKMQDVEVRLSCQYIFILKEMEDARAQVLCKKVTPSQEKCCLCDWNLWIWNFGIWQQRSLRFCSILKNR